MTLEIDPEALTSAVAAELIAALNVELSARYPEPGATQRETERWLLTMVSTPIDVLHHSEGAI